MALPRDRDTTGVCGTVFAEIYKTNEWGVSEDRDQPFFSGCGSSDPAIVEPYVRAISKLLTSHPAFVDRKPDVVDLGCGDFAVGSRLRGFCAGYVACDVVDKLIEFNKRRFADLNVDFRVLDLVVDPLPPGEIVFVRQVFQHLSNDQIAASLSRIATRYKYLVLTEHLPREPFTHNPDIERIGGWRVSGNGGVVLTSPPFLLRVFQDITLLECPDDMGRIQTKFYQLF
jgi:hypothetical protein